MFEVLKQFFYGGGVTRAVPEVGAMLSIHLPGEKMRVPVVAVYDEDTVQVELTATPTTKGHSYRRNDLVVCERKQTDMEERWEARDDRRAFAAEPVPEVVPVVPEVKKAAVKRAPVKKVAAKVPAKVAPKKVVKKAAKR